MQILRSNEIVAQSTERQAELVDALAAHDVVPQMVIFRDTDGSQRRDVRSYTGALRRHIAPFAGKLSLPVERLVDVRTMEYRDLESAITDAGQDPTTHGIMVMSPTSGDFEALAACITPEKDIDRMNPATRGLLQAQGRNAEPATPQAVRDMLVAHDLWRPDLAHTLVGRGRTVGRFVDEDLRALHGDNYHRNARVITHSNETELPEAIQNSDVLIVAAGVPNQITARMIHPGIRAVVGVCIGDIDPSVYDVQRDLLVTPPHNHQEHWGVGANTSSIAWDNTLESAEATLFAKAS